ncbi:MAG: phosphomannomutase/phosphoglucomutase [bacterium]
MNPSIFKAYDIRGVYPQELDEKSAYAIGRAFVKFLRAKTILVGQDSRPSSPALLKALTRGITEAGADVVLAGALTTPMFYFAVANGKKYGGGIMVTASHNPAKYNGFKLVRGDARPVEPAELLPIIKSKSPSSILPLSKGEEGGGRGKITKIKIQDAYIKKLLSLADVKKIQPIKIVIDAGNGMAGAIVSKILTRLPQIKAEKLFFGVDMSFPNHEANPINEATLATLKKTVIKNKAALGVAYDGDADRIGFVDEKGNAVRSDFIFSAILPQILKHENMKTKKHENKKTIILYDLRCSKIVPETIMSLGGKPQMTRVGHAFIKKQLRAAKAAAAAELSSHFYFKDFYGVECSDLVMLYLLLEIGETKKPLSEIVKPFARYFQSGEINFEVKDKNAKISALLKKYKKSATGFSDIDGIRMEFKDSADWWWLNVRPSNTEPLLRLNMEANNKQLLSEKLKELTEILKH